MLVENAQDVLEAQPGLRRRASVLPPPAESSGAAREAAQAHRHADPQEHALLQALGYDPVDLDTLQARTGLPTPQLQAQLMALELDGQVMRLPGGLFQRMALA